LLIDQIEDLFSNRSNDNQSSLHNSHDRLVACLLTEMDGLAARREGDGVFILATTSYIENIDSAILRPGRIESHFFMLPFDQDMRRLFIGNKLTKMPIFLTDEQMEKLVNRTNGYSAAELDGLFREAALITLRDDINSDRISFDTLYNITR
jgi:transitional endoplasmic reticulum ATPase